MSDQVQINQPNSFDEVPIGNPGLNKFNVSEYADGYSQQSLPPTIDMTVHQKIQSKVVKIKLEGLEELRNLLSDRDKAKDLDIQVYKIVKENNPACLEKALQCAEKWMEMGRPWGQRQIRQIIESGYINGKGSTKKLACDIILKAYSTKQEEIQKTLIQSGLKNKTPKLVGGYLSIINQLLQEYGIKDLKYLKPYLQITVNIMNNQKLPAVKNQGMNLFKNGIKWLGKDFIWPMLSQLKDNMKKELENFWDSYDKTQVMKANRQDAVQVHGVKDSGNQVKNNDRKGEMISSPGAGLDLYDIYDPVDVFSKFDEKWSESVLQTEKWSSKTELLNQLISKASVPRLLNTEHRHITEMIRRLMNDSNFNVVLCSLKLTGTLAKGLRKNYTHSAKILFPYIIIKLRQKRIQMIEETLSTLNNFSYCISIEEVGEDIKSGLKDKTPNMKNNMLKWIIQCLDKDKDKGSDRTVQFLKSSGFYTIVEGLLNDPNAEVRDFAVKLVCKARSVYGEQVFKGIDKNISNKDILQKLMQGKSSEQPVLSRSRTAKSQKKAQSKGKSANKHNKEDQQPLSTGCSSYSLKPNNSGILDITQQLSKNLKKLNDSINWQNRKQSAQKLIRFFQDIQKENSKIGSQILYDFLGILKTRIADPNKQLIKVFVALVAEVFKCLAQKEAKNQGKIFMQELMEALADKNQANRKQIYRAFDSICLSIGPEQFFGNFGQILSQQSPASSSSSSNIIKQHSLQYLLSSQPFTTQIQNLPPCPSLPKQLREFPKIIMLGLCDKNKDLRTVCQKIFKIMSQSVGIDVFKGFVNSKDMKSAFKGDLIGFLGRVGEGGAWDINCLQGSAGNQKMRGDQAVPGQISPSASKVKLLDVSDIDKRKSKLSTGGSLANSRSKGKINKLTLDQGNKTYISNTSFVLKQLSKQVQGSQPFASQQTLTSQRSLRSQQSSLSSSSLSPCSPCSPCSPFSPSCSQQQLQSFTQKVLNYQDLYVPMYSNNYHKNLEACQKLIKLCRDVAHTSSIRQVYDLLLKWVLVKIYGGNLACGGLVELVVPLLTVLEKKRVVFGEGDVQLVVGIVREYAVILFYENSDNIQTIKTILKLTVALSSGQRVLKTLLPQYKTDMGTIHKHITQIRNNTGLSFPKYYKKQLVLICGYFIDYFSNSQLLEEAASITQLVDDKGFVGLMCGKFQESVLREFGFLGGEPGKRREGVWRVEGCGRESPRGASPAMAFFGLEKSKAQAKTKKTTPQKLPIAEPSPTPPHSRQIPDNLPIRFQSLPQICKLLCMQILPPPTTLLQASQFPQPSPHNPLSSNIQRLFPYSQQSIHFFSTLFQPHHQNIDKISSELSVYGNVIYVGVYNALLRLLQLPNRQQHSPQKVSIFLSLTQQMIRCQNMYKWVDERIIQRSIRGIIQQLVYEDENRVQIQTRLRNKFGQYKGDIFVKGVNGVMLRLLDNSYPVFLVSVLLYEMVEVFFEGSLDLVGKSKKMGLLVRCFNRVTTTYFSPSSTPSQKQHHPAYNIEEDISCIKPNHINRLLILTKEYLQAVQVTDLWQFETRETNRVSTGNTSNQDSVILCLCKILRLLQKKNLLTKPLQSLKKQHPTQSFQILQTYLTQIRTPQDQSQLQLQSQLQPSHNQNDGGMGMGSSGKLDEEMRKIVQQLSKGRTFQEGVKGLRNYVMHSGGKFDYKGVFSRMNFQAGFMDKVEEEMNKYNVGSSQKDSRSLNPDIQNKIQRLKMKLECLNQPSSTSSKQKQMIAPSSTQHQKQQQSKTPRVRDREISNKSIEHSTTQNDLKRRIEQMKNKVSLSTNKMR